MNRVRTQRIAARRQRGLLCTTTFQEFEWYAIEDVDYEDVQDEIPETSFEPGMPLVDEVDSMWRIDMD